MILNELGLPPYDYLGSIWYNSDLQRPCTPKKYQKGNLFFGRTVFWIGSSKLCLKFANFQSIISILWLSLRFQFWVANESEITLWILGLVNFYAKSLVQVNRYIMCTHSKILLACLWWYDSRTVHTSYSIVLSTLYCI